MRLSAMVPERLSVRPSKVAVPMVLESSSAPSASVLSYPVYTHTH